MITTFLIAHAWLTTAAFFSCLVVGPVVGYVLVDRRQWALGLAVVSLVPVAALTLTPADREMAVSCAVEWSLPTLGAVELMANVVLFIPLTLLLSIASRRPLLALTGASTLSAVIEVVQAFATGLGRSCSTNDWLSNSLGAVVGAVLAALALWVHHEQSARGLVRA